MTPPTLSSPNWIGRLSTPTLIVALFVLALSGCVLGLVVWKGYDSRKIALAQSETEIRNLVHSLAEHAAHSVQGVDVVMDDIVSFLRWRPVPVPAFNDRLREIVGNLPQLSELAVIDAQGDVRYASVAPLPRFNNADRGYFLHHRDHADRKLLISGPIQSRNSGRWTIALSRRLETSDGGFAGVVVGTIESNYFSDFYKTIDLGPGGSVSLMRNDGRLLTQWPSLQAGRDMSDSVLFRGELRDSPGGYQRITSPFDGLMKYLAYERISRYPLVVTVARTEESVLAGWREAVRSDAVVASGMLTCVALLAAVLAAQLRSRQQVETLLREREARFRLIDAHIGDIVILLDRDRNLDFVSMSIETVLGIKPEHVLGRGYIALLHPEDLDALRHTADLLRASSVNRRVEFRTWRADGTLVWLEAHFRPTGGADADGADVVGALRDVTRRKAMEDEVEALNARLAELARTDGLTGLPNRRSLDGFIVRAFDADRQLAVLMIDVDDFKGFNDHFGHQAGDDALKQLGGLLAKTVAEARGFAARYGGEEFTVVLPDAGRTAATDFAEALQAAVRALGIRNPASARGGLTVSIGVASKDDGTADATSLLREADIALYEAKRSGRDCIVVAPAAAFVADAAPLAPDHPPAEAAPPQRPARTA